MSWLCKNYQWLLSILVQVVIAYHLFFLSKRLSNKAKLEHKDKIKQKVDEILARIHKEKLDSDVHLVNVRRYFKDYPSHQEKRFEGYSHIKVEIKATRFDGVEFFSAMPVEIFRTAGGELSFNSRGNAHAFSAFPVGVVPYEWIEHIDPDGDEYDYLPLFYCHFKNRTKPIKLELVEALSIFRLSLQETSLLSRK